jgi:hypothetical protein
MVKKDTSDEDAKAASDKAYQAAIEEKVRQMLDPEVKDAPASVPAAEPAIVPSTAPELNDAHVPEPVEDTKESAKEPASASPEDDNPPEPNEDDPETEKAVDDIVAKESDDLLTAEDEKLAEAFDVKKPKLTHRIKQALVDWWHDPKKRRITMVTLGILLAAAIVVPNSRYFLLNSAGVRSSASLIILDDSTQLPLKNVKVNIGNQSGETDNEGKVRLSHLRLGRSRLVVEKRAFAVLERNVTIGWGSNPLGDFKITPTGSQYTFVFTDYLSGKPVDKVEAISGESSALSNQEGVLKLTIDTSDAEKNELPVTILAEGYRQEMVTLNLDNQGDTKLQLVPANKHVFISKRSGRYDVYKIDADGQNEERVLSGTGHERDDMVLVPHPTEKLAALVSTRDNARNADGFLLSTLTVIDLATNTPAKVAQSERIQIVNWSEKRLVFVQIAAGASASDPKRHRLMSYDTESGQTKELASANYFNDVFSIKSLIYYAPSSAYTTEKASMFRVNADSTNKQTVFPSEVWNVYRTEYDKLILAVNQDWYEYGIADNKSSKLPGEPANLRFRIYVDSPDHKRSLWVDDRDGKGVLLAYDLETGSDKVALEKSGLSDPVRWLSNDAIVFRVSTSAETADYVMSLSGGEPKKLKDVTNTSGIDRWYYY